MAALGAQSTLEPHLTDGPRGLACDEVAVTPSDPEADAILCRMARRHSPMGPRPRPTLSDQTAQGLLRDSLVRLLGSGLPG